MMEKIKEYKEIIFNLIKLTLPILGGNLGQVLMMFADNAIAGRYSTTALGAISVASAIVLTLTIGSIGLMLSISPVIANFRGKNISTKRYFKLTLLFSLIVSIPFFILLELLIKNIDLIGLQGELIEPVKQYLEVSAWGIFPTIIFVAIKEFLQAWEKVIFANVLMFVMIILNIFLNYAFVFGYDFYGLHINSMGVVGISIATLIARVIVAIILLIYSIPLLKDKFAYSFDYIKDLLKVGTPIAFSIFFEFLGFNLTAIIIGKFSSLFAAVHNIILCLANFTFMIVLSVANAASVKIGYFNGKKDKTNVIKYSLASVGIIFTICCMTFLIIAFFNDFIISIFTKDIEVIKWCKKILKIVMCFLFFDGLQGIMVGILKGLKDTKIIMYIMLIAYLVIAIPIGTFIAYHFGYILEGFWSALALALFFVAIITTHRVIKIIRKIKE